jgi:hypothetical protein
LQVGQTDGHPITWSNYRNQPVYNLALDVKRVKIDEIQLRLFSTARSFYLRPTACRFGGVRWLFRCPRCGRRSAKLYLPRGSVFLCRTCHALTYESCIDGKSMTAFFA